MGDRGQGGFEAPSEPPGRWTVGVGGIVGGAWILMLGDARGHHNAFDMSQPTSCAVDAVECVLQNFQIYDATLNPPATHILSVLPPATNCLDDDAQAHPSLGPDVDLG